LPGFDGPPHGGPSCFQINGALMTRGVLPRVAATGRPQTGRDDVTRLVALSLIAGLAAVIAVVWRSLV
jgi:hypothetical protein